MKKELLIAIVSGLFLGLIVTLGIFTANKALNEQKQKKLALTPSTTPVPNSNHQQKNLNITSHESFDLINQSEVTLAGIAWPEAIVTLLSEKDNLLVQADNEGIFTFKFNLIKGFNEITVIATDESGNTQTNNLVLSYSTSKLVPWRKY